MQEQPSSDQPTGDRTRRRSPETPFTPPPTPPRQQQPADGEAKARPRRTRPAKAAPAVLFQPPVAEPVEARPPTVTRPRGAGGDTVPAAEPTAVADDPSTIPAQSATGGVPPQGGSANPRKSTPRRATRSRAASGDAGNAAPALPDGQAPSGQASSEPTEPGTGSTSEGVTTPPRKRTARKATPTDDSRQTARMAAPRKRATPTKPVPPAPTAPPVAVHGDATAPTATPSRPTPAASTTLAETATPMKPATPAEPVGPPGPAAHAESPGPAAPAAPEPAPEPAVPAAPEPAAEAVEPAEAVELIAAVEPVEPIGAPSTAAATGVTGVTGAGGAESGRTTAGELAALRTRLLAHPGFAPELLAMAAVEGIGPRAREWAHGLRAAYPDADPDGLARLATRRYVRLAGVGGAAAAGAGVFAPLAELAVVLWTQSALVLHLAAAYGRDPVHPDRAVEVLVLTQVHPDADSARAALDAARAADGPGEGPWPRAVEAAWRLAAPLAAQAGGWAVLRLVARVLPGAAVLAAAAGDAAATERLAARTVTGYRRGGADGGGHSQSNHSRGSDE